MELSLYVAGRAQANPGLASAAIVITGPDNTPLYEAAYFLGNQTIEGAGYNGLLRGLEYVARQNPETLQIFAADDFLVQHVTGQLLVANPALEMLHEQAQLMLLRLKRWSIRKTPEGAGKRASDLAAEALHQQSSRIAVESGPQNSAVLDHEPGTSPDNSPQPAAPDDLPAPLGRHVHVQITSKPRSECPAGDWCPALLTIGNTLPAGVCVHAAHAITPTILAMFNADAAEFTSIPTLTVRCSRPGCPATFHISPTTAPQT